MQGEPRKGHLQGCAQAQQRRGRCTAAVLAQRVRYPHHVVVGKCPAGPATRRHLFKTLHKAAEVSSTCAQCLASQSSRPCAACHHRWCIQQHGPEPSSSPISPTIVVLGYSSSKARSSTQESQVLGLAFVVLVPLPAVRVHGIDRRVFAVGTAACRVVAQLGVVEVEIGGIQAIAIYPEIPTRTSQSPEQSAPCTSGIVEVQVRLAGQEVVHVVLATAGVPLPCTATENGQPVVRRVCRRVLASAQMYQSALGLSRLERLSTNQGCWSELWDSTWSIMTLRPSACARSTNFLKSCNRAEHRDRRHSSH